jgi:hypothetical protein
MADSNTDRIRQLRLRAEEVRTIGDAMQDLDARRTLFGVAENYERLANTLERLARPSGERQDEAG